MRSSKKFHAGGEGAEMRHANVHGTQQELNSSGKTFSASNGLILTPGGYPSAETAHLAQAEPMMLVDARDEARSCGFDVSFWAQRENAFKPSGESVTAAFRNLKPVHVGNSRQSDPRPQSYAIDPYVPRGVVTLLGAHGGDGKSTLALTLCAHFAVGRKWAGCQMGQGRAVFVSLEDPPAQIGCRLQRVLEAYGLDRHAVISNLIILDGTEGDAALATEQSGFAMRRLTETATMQELRKLAAGAGLIVVDNASDAYDGDENNRRQVRGFIRMLTGIARDNDAGLILLAHVDKTAARYGSNGNSYSGSTAWHNSVRSRLALTQAKGAVQLRQEKLNFGRPADPLVLRWSEHGVLTPDVVAGGPRHSRSDEESVLAAIRAALAAGTDVGAARTGPSNTQMVLTTFEELPTHLRGTSGRDAFWAALGGLLKQGIVCARQTRGSNRHVRQCLIETDAPTAPEKAARANPPHPLPRGARTGASAREFALPRELAQTGADASPHSSVVAEKVFPSAQPNAIDKDAVWKEALRTRLSRT